MPKFSDFFCFVHNSVVCNVRTKIMAPSYSRRRDKSNDLCFDLERSNSNFNLRSRSQIELTMSCRISYDAPGLCEHIGAYPTSLA